MASVTASPSASAASSPSEGVRLVRESSLFVDIGRHAPLNGIVQVRSLYVRLARATRLVEARPVTSRARMRACSVCLRLSRALLSLASAQASAPCPGATS